MPRKIGFNESLGPLNEIEDYYKKEKLKHLVLHGETDTANNIHIAAFPPEKTTPGQLWFNSEDGCVYLLYDDDRELIWVRTYEK